MTNFAKKPIVQLCAVERFNILLSLSGAHPSFTSATLHAHFCVDSIISVCDLRLQSNPYTLKRSSGCSCFALDIAGETYRLAVAVKKKLYFFTWNGDKFLDNSKVCNCLFSRLSFSLLVFSFLICFLVSCLCVRSCGAGVKYTGYSTANIMGRQ